MWGFSMKRLRRAGGAAGGLTLVLIGALLILASCDAGFQLDQLLDGDGGELTIDPESARLGFGARLTFEASGGYPPYAFSTDGNGVIDEDGVYTAPGAEGSETVTVTDAVRRTATASVTIVDPDRLFIDYRADSISWEEGNLTDGSVSGTFSFSNVGDDLGTHDVDWQVFASQDPSFDILDTTDAHRIDTGTDPPLGAGESSGPVLFTGIWPSEGGDYYLFVRLYTTPNDVNTGNNEARSSVVEVNPPLTDYTVPEVTSTFGSVTTGSSISERFKYRNIGNADGAAQVSHSVYISLDDDLDTGIDTLVVDSQPVGDPTGLAATTTSAYVDIDGFWPGTAGTYHLIVAVDAADDSNVDNNWTAAGPFSVSEPPDYEVSAPAFDVLDYGGNLSESIVAAATDHGGSGTHRIRITELSLNGGLQDITWAVYASTNTTLDGLDTQVAGDTIGALAGGASVTIDLSYNLPDSWGYWYYIFTASAGDDSNLSNNTVIVGPVHVWSNASDANVQTDVGFNDLSPVDAKDFRVLLNAGDTSYFNGTMEQDEFRDGFTVYTGQDTEYIDVLITWPAPAPQNDNMNFRVFGSGALILDDEGSNPHLVTESLSSDPSKEEKNNIDVDPSDRYYVVPISKGSDGQGYEYRVEVTAH